MSKPMDEQKYQDLIDGADLPVGVRTRLRISLLLASAASWMMENGIDPETWIKSELEAEGVADFTSAT